MGYGHRSSPEAERAAQETLAIPLYPEMTEKQKRGDIHEHCNGE